MSVNLAQFANSFVDDSVSKPITAYANTPAIANLAAECGNRLEQLDGQDKYLFALCLLDYLGTNDPCTYTMQDAIEFQAPSNLLDENLALHLNTLADEGSVNAMKAIVLAIANILLHDE
jgi:hypothetical protein